MPLHRRLLDGLSIHPRQVTYARSVSYAHMCSFLGAGREYSVKYVWAYMLLGQIVAISVASNLFYLALILSRRTNSSKPATTLDLWVTVLVSLATIARSPFTTERTFLPNLLAMHSLILVPLLPWPRSWRISCGYNHRNLYAVALIVSITLRIRSTKEVMQSLLPDRRSVSDIIYAAWATLGSHPAQSSIGWDVVWTVVSFVVWVCLAPLRPPKISTLERRSRRPSTDRLS